MGNVYCTKKQISLGIGCACFISSYFWFKPVLRKLCKQLIRYAKQEIKLNHPKRIILIRHGESEANIDHSIYSQYPDSEISLTERGRKQAEEASAKLKDLIGSESVKFWVSPFRRGQETFDILKSRLSSDNVAFNIDPRLREQEFGNLSDKDTLSDISVSLERKKLGKFFYRYSNGESGADVYDRVSLFLDTFYREINDVEWEGYENCIVVCHGLFMRLFVMRFTKMSIEKFELMANPGNCETWIFEKDENGKYNLKNKINFKEKPDN